MSRYTRAVCIAALLITAAPSGFPQLRYISPYSEDRINTDQTFFVLKNPTTALFGWASEWTQLTVQNYEDNQAIFLWHFKDGTKAYSRYVEYDIGDAGKSTSYLLKSNSSDLEDASRKKIQPLTLSNYPVKIELWVGEVSSTGYRLDTMMGESCLDAKSIELGRTYHFSDCPS
jgi:hypothetical protein